MMGAQRENKGENNRNFEKGAVFHRGPFLGIYW